MNMACPILIFHDDVKSAEAVERAPDDSLGTIFLADRGSYCRDDHRLVVFVHDYAFGHTACFAYTQKLMRESL
jgi:hypothetical protein